jgi:Trk K+ transport system NAD-binding subunit
MAYVTQAGIGLGLAKSVVDQFPSFGTEFAAMIIAVIVLSQIVGPPLFKWAIRRVGESHTRGAATPDEIRDALILGIDDQSLALERQLTANDWKVIMADTDESHVKRLQSTDVEAHHIEKVDEASISKLVSGATDAVVAMLGDDKANYKACELVFEKFGVPRLVVRLNDLSWSDSFDELNVRIVEPTSAMINLLDQFVRVPKLAEILLHRDPEHDVVQVTIDDPDIEGLKLRDLRLPPNVRLLGISRDGHAIVPQGNTVLYHNDEITLVGKPGDLRAVAARWGY